MTDILAKYVDRHYGGWRAIAKKPASTNPLARLLPPKPPKLPDQLPAA